MNKTLQALPRCLINARLVFLVILSLLIHSFGPFCDLLLCDFQFDNALRNVCWDCGVRYELLKAWAPQCTRQLQINMKMKTNTLFYLAVMQRNASCSLDSHIFLLLPCCAKRAAPPCLLGNMQMRWRGRLWLDMQPPGTLWLAESTTGARLVFIGVAHQNTETRPRGYSCTHTQNDRQTITKRHAEIS